MRLRTLGGLRLEGAAFARPKPLLLATYLALEGPRPRRYLAELFWPDGADPLRSLAVALVRLRQGAPGSVDGDHRTVRSDLGCDAVAFERALDRGDEDAALALYAGPFLDGVTPARIGTELEEWIWARRDRLATRAQRAQVRLALKAVACGDPTGASARAEAARALPHAAPEPDTLVLLHDLALAAGRATARELRREAEGLDLPFAPDPDTARERVEEAARTVADDAGSPSAATGTPADLPPFATAFVGRKPELAQIADLLARPGPAVTTLTGPPGGGKTRLAAQIAADPRTRERWPDGVRFVPLAGVSGPESLAPHIAAAFGLDVPAEADAALDRLGEFLRGRGVLIVLDEAEDLLPDGAAAFARLAEAGPDAAWLIASRVRTGLAMERVVPVLGLDVPPLEETPGAEALRTDAPALFLRRAQRAAPEFEPADEDVAAIVRICRRVEGLPLALELAAAWVRVLPPSEIADALDRDVELLATDAPDVPERHRSVRAAFEHAWRRMSDRDRSLARRLSVCEGGFRLEQARAVAGAGPHDLARLIDASLLRTDGRGRYDMHALPAAFVEDRAAARPEERAEARRAHARAYLDLLTRSEEDLAGGPDQERQVARIAEDLANVRAAVRTAAKDGDARALWATCRPLQLFFIQRGGRWDDAIRTFAEAGEALQAHARHDDGLEGAVLGRLESARAWFHFRSGENDAAHRWAERALARLRSAAHDDPDDPAVHRALASVRNTLANVALRRGDLKRAERRFEEIRASALERGLTRQVAIAANNLGLVRKAAGDLAGAERAYREALRRNREHGNRRSEVRNRVNLGTCLIVAGRAPEAEAVLDEGLRLARATGFDAMVPTLLATAAAAALRADRVAGAEARAQEALDLLRHAPDPRVEADVRIVRAESALARGDARAAREEASRALRLSRGEDAADTVAQAALALAAAFRTEGRFDRAATVLGAAEALPPRTRWVRDRLARARRTLTEESIALAAGASPRQEANGQGRHVQALDERALDACAADGAGLSANELAELAVGPEPPRSSPRP